MVYLKYLLVSSTGVGGYKEREEGKEVKQFKTNDERSPIEILKELYILINKEYKNSKSNSYWLWRRIN